MNKQHEQQNPLRSAAKARLAHTPLPLAPARSAEELLHELQVHQIELEMLNEELRQSQLSLEESRDHYANFYDFAPVGYLTLTDKGLVSEINLTDAKLLGVERSKLLHQRLAHFVSPEDSDRWHRHFQATLKRNEKQTCEMLFKFADGSKFHAQLDCLHLLNENKETTVVHHCTSSIGVALFTNKGNSADDILKWADMAMYQAKNDGRNQIRFFDPNVPAEPA